MSQEGIEKIEGKEIVTSDNEIRTSSTFRNETQPGTLLKKIKHTPEYTDLRLKEIIDNCPKEFSAALLRGIMHVKLNYPDASKRELAIVTEALIENHKAYVERKVKDRMTPEEAIAKVRQLLAQQKFETSE
ncbi:MAG TPA: hypothetical protein VGO63_01605 [Candidatus Paceibacterota bacterium]|jgi:hypothetical protein|nr:hypothetical protein [Candidatus Paceibacterota bacterium]